MTPQQKKQPKNKYTGPVGVDESTYRYLNALFEAILETVTPQQSDTYSIKDYLNKYYNLDLSEHDLGFLNAVIQDVDSDAWRKGYDDCAEDTNVY